MFLLVLENSQSGKQRPRHVLGLPATMSKIYLYAEVLSNIGQVTLHASLETYKNEGTKFFITSDQRTITVQHEGEIAHLFLPVKIAGTAKLTLPAQRAKELSFRLQIEEATHDLPHLTALNDETYWSSTALQSQAQLQCRSCKHEILLSGRKMLWKDLPSENWAELMEYWHCHKPHNEDDDSATANGATRKGYGASSKIVAEQGIGLVDVSSFLLASTDCPGAQVRDLFPTASKLFGDCIAFSYVTGNKKETSWAFYHLVADTIAQD